MRKLTLLFLWAIGGLLVGLFIKKQRRAEAELRRQALAFATMFDAAILTDAAGRIIDWNPAAVRMFGYTKEEVQGQSPELIHYPADRPHLQQTILEGIYNQGRWAGEVRFCTRDGRDGVLEVIVVALHDASGAVIGTVGVNRDITGRRQAEQEIRRQNRELNLLNKSISAPATGLTAEGVLETACRELAQTFDLPRVLAVTLNEERTEAVVLAEYRAGGPPLALGKMVPVTDAFPSDLAIGQPLPVVVNAQADPHLAPWRDLLGCHPAFLLLPLEVEGDVIGSLILATAGPRSFSPDEISLAGRVADQVAGALARARLAQVQQRLITVIEQVAESVVITTTEGLIVYVNPAFEGMSGYSQAEVIGQNARMLKSGKHSQAYYQELWQTIKAGQVWKGSLINQKKDGTLYTVEAIINPVRNDRGDIVNFVGVHRDVTRELQLEEQYRQAQKMEAIGQLTGGIAHDFNNLLTVINGFARLINAQLPPDHELQELSQKILQAGQRAADLVRQLLAFSRQQVIQPRVIILNQVVADMDKMLRRVIGEEITLDTVLAADLWPVKVDPAQIEQIIVNLAVNARDAMPVGGRLIIQTSNVVLDEFYTAQHVEAQPGEYVLLAVSDTGAGMTEEVLEHIFEPFFTTKEVGKGTGLGLATVFGIIKQNHGHIWVYSEPGHGSTFKIYLPRERIVATAPAARSSWLLQALPTGTETVLLVEDELSVRELAGEVLRQQGYTVLEATNGEEALQLVKSYEGQIDLLLTDVTMPRMGGKALVTQLKALQPNLKVVFISGHTGHAIDGVLDEGAPLLQKPFTLASLITKVREVLDG